MQNRRYFVYKHETCSLYVTISNYVCRPYIELKDTKYLPEQITIKLERDIVVNDVCQPHSLELKFDQAIRVFIPKPCEHKTNVVHSENDDICVATQNV